MRLIDADELKVNCVCLNAFCVDGRTIENAPTVEAIPIEWIKEQIEWYRKRSVYLDEKYADNKDFLNDAEIVVVYYEALIKNWEKENEESSNRD